MLVDDVILKTRLSLCCCVVLIHCHIINMWVIFWGTEVISLVIVPLCLKSFWNMIINADWTHLICCCPHLLTSCPAVLPSTVQFNRCVTSQMIKWFSNFREFFYIQMERFARQAVREALSRCVWVHVKLIWCKSSTVWLTFKELFIPTGRYMIQMWSDSVLMGLFVRLCDPGKVQLVRAERVSCEWAVTRSFTASWTCTTIKATSIR